ncbi:MAG TPA: HAMP domain-containing sensor histidine kinase [Candidatus Paceibacterota bacterium]
MKSRLLFFPLWLKLVVVIVVAALPLAALTLLLSDVWSFLGVSGLFVRTDLTHIGQYEVPLVYVAGGSALLLALLLGLIASEALFLTSARRTLRWLLELRRGEFKVVPPLGRTGADEIGEIGRQVAFAALTFSRQKEQSDASIEQRSLFLMTAAHQLRTPLTGLLWTIDTLQNAATSEAERARSLLAVGESVRRMRLVIEHILASASIEEGKYGYVFEQADMVPVIEELVSELKPLSEHHQIDLAFLHEGSVPAHIDKERISLALFDLMSNAIQYTPARGHVRVSLNAAGGRVEVAIEDTGIGISEDERALLFNKFYRGERARHMHPDGSGLGLYLARTIIQKHGSDIAIQSAEGKGTRISFFLKSKR